MRPIKLFLIVCLSGLAACSDRPPDTLAEISLQSPDSYATQAVQVQLTSRADQQSVVATVESANRLEQQQLAYNAVLLATVRADQVATPVERVAMTEGGAMSAEMLNLADGEMTIQQIGLAGFVRPEDSCFETHQQYFARMTTDIIYISGLITNVQEGTRFSVDWIYDNEIVYSAAWSAPLTEPRRCLAIPMRASEVVFNTGSWSARLFMNGIPIDNSAFEIVN